MKRWQLFILAALSLAIGLGFIAGLTRCGPPPVLEPTPACARYQTRCNGNAVEVCDCTPSLQGSILFEGVLGCSDAMHWRESYRCHEGTACAGVTAASCVVIPH
jgi:hypothetical protein